MKTLKFIKYCEDSSQLVESSSKYYILDITIVLSIYKLRTFSCEKCNVTWVIINWGLSCFTVINIYFSIHCIKLMGIKSFLFFDTYHETVNYPSHRDPAPRLHFSDYLVQVKDKVHLKYRNLTMACYPPATLMNSCCIYNQSIFS